MQYQYFISYLLDFEEEERDEAIKSGTFKPGGMYFFLNLIHDILLNLVYSNEVLANYFSFRTVMSLFGRKVGSLYQKIWHNSAKACMCPLSVGQSNQITDLLLSSSYQEFEISNRVGKSSVELLCSLEFNDEERREAIKTGTFKPKGRASGAFFHVND